jgi:hypothetical protein
MAEWRHSYTSALGEGKWSASRSGHFTPRERHRYQFRRLGGLQNRSGRRDEGKESLPLPGIEPRSSNP